MRFKYLHCVWLLASILHNVSLVHRLACTEQEALGSQVLVAHTCNPSYSGGRDQEDLCPGQIVQETLSRKNPLPKRSWWSGSR
jgi:hypothetical protein